MSCERLQLENMGQLASILCLITYGLFYDASTLEVHMH